MFAAYYFSIFRLKFNWLFTGFENVTPVSYYIMISFSVFAFSLKNFTPFLNINKIEATMQVTNVGGMQEYHLFNYNI